VQSSTQTRKLSGFAGFLLSNEIQRYSAKSVSLFVSFAIVVKKGHNRGHELANNINKDTVYRAAKSKEKDYMVNGLVTWTA